MRSAYRHEGSARRAVHQLKYSAGVGFASALAAEMVGLLPSEAALLVPIPRSWGRLLAYGVDPAAELARAVAGLSGLPAADLIRHPWWVPARAGQKREARRPPRFRSKKSAPGIVLIDDVVTTGTTLAAAASAFDIAPVGAVTATAA